MYLYSLSWFVSIWKVKKKIPDTHKLSSSRDISICFLTMETCSLVELKKGSRGGLGRMDPHRHPTETISFSRRFLFHHPCHCLLSRIYDTFFLHFSHHLSFLYLFIFCICWNTFSIIYEAIFINNIFSTHS